MSFSELQGDYDLIIAGTGLTECLVSGCFSQSGKKLLHFERSSEYGGFLKTKGIKDFIKWSKENGELIIDRIEEKLGSEVRNGAYCIDLFPLIYFSRDKIIDVLVNSNGFESVNAFLIDGLYYRSKEGFRQIPTSKSSIFSDKSLPLRQKRAVMKFVSYFLPPEEYGHAIDFEDIKAKVEEYNDKPFKELMDSLSFGDDLAGAFEYFVANASEPLITKVAVERIKKFLSSFGRWGPTPFITFSYGASEVPQALSRFSSVHGGLFILNHYPKQIERDENGLVLTVDDIGTIKTKALVASPEHIESTGEEKFIANREVLLLSKKLLDCERSIAVIAPGVLGNEKPVYIYQFDGTLRCCQENEYLVHLSSTGELRSVCDKLAEEIGDENIIFRTAFSLKENVPKKHECVYLVPSPSLNELSMGSNYFVDAAIEIVKQINPDIEFYPKPTEVEIVVEEPQQQESANSIDENNINKNDKNETKENDKVDVAENSTQPEISESPESNNSN